VPQKDLCLESNSRPATGKTRRQSLPPANAKKKERRDAGSERRKGEDKTIALSVTGLPLLLKLDARKKEKDPPFQFPEGKGGNLLSAKGKKKKIHCCQPIAPKHPNVLNIEPNSKRKKQTSKPK